MNYDDPIAQAIYFGVISVAILYILHWLTENRGDDVPTRWQNILARYVVAVPLADDLANDENASVGTVSTAKRNSENGEITQQQAEIASEMSNLRKTETIEAETLARLVIAGKLGITDAVKIGMQAKSGERYSRMTRLLQLEIARQKVNYPPLSAEQKDARQQLKLDD